jgi:hypothetical protein
MNLIDAVREGIQLPTWSLCEAAYFAHNLNPAEFECPPDEKEPTPQGVTYRWLIKEYKNGGLTVTGGDRQNPRFCPGTLLRRLKNKGKPFNELVLVAHKNPKKMKGPSTQNSDAKFDYIHAAEEIRKIHPKLRKGQLSELLTQLPHYKPGVPIRRKTTIHKKYLKALGPDLHGRPKVDELDLPRINWLDIVSKI